MIVDDGSTDAATQVAAREHIAAEDARDSSAARRARRGAKPRRSPARPAATCARSTPTIASSRRIFEKAVPILDADPSVTFVSCWLRTFGDEEWEWKPERCDLPTLLWEDTVLTAALVRRDAVLAVGGYDTAMPVQGDEDWDLWLTLVERGHRGVILPEVLFNYRRRAGSMSTVCWYGPGHLPLATIASPSTATPTGRTCSTCFFIRTMRPRRCCAETTRSNGTSRPSSSRRWPCDGRNWRPCDRGSQPRPQRRVAEARRDASANSSRRWTRLSRGDRAADLDELACHRAAPARLRLVAPAAGDRMTPGRIAAVITCRDLGRTLLEALESVERQTRPAAEIVVVDDGSTDIYTRQVLARLERDGTRVVQAGGRGRVGGPQSRRAAHVGRLPRLARRRRRARAGLLRQLRPHVSMRSPISISCRARCARSEPRATSGRPRSDIRRRGVDRRRAARVDDDAAAAVGDGRRIRREPSVVRAARLLGVRDRTRLPRRRPRRAAAQLPRARRDRATGVRFSRTPTSPGFGTSTPSIAGPVERHGLELIQARKRSS